MLAHNAHALAPLGYKVSDRTDCVAAAQQKPHIKITAHAHGVYVCVVYPMARHFTQCVCSLVRWRAVFIIRCGIKCVRSSRTLSPLYGASVGCWMKLSCGLNGRLYNSYMKLDVVRSRLSQRTLRTDPGQCLKYTPYYCVNRMVNGYTRWCKTYGNIRLEYTSTSMQEPTSQCDTLYINTAHTHKKRTICFSASAWKRRVGRLARVIPP